MRAPTALLLLALAPPLGAPARQEAGRAAVAAAALSAVHEKMPAGKGAYDPEGYCTAHLRGWSCPGEISSTVASLGMTLSSRLFTRVCIGGSGRCRLLGVEWLVRFEEPEMRGSKRATVDATVWRHESAGRGPVVEERYRVTLRRAGSGWSAERVEALGSD